MGLKLDDKWVWDSWYAFDGERWRMFYLQAPKSIGDPELRHWNVSIGQAASADLRSWEVLADPCFAPAQAPAWDDYTTWTGSVIRDPDGRWRLYYTGSSRAENGLKQRIGLAVSDDLLHWERRGMVLDLDPDIYEEWIPGRWHDRAWRDPWVIEDPDGDGWLMFFTARKKGIADAREAGAIGLATSPDLERWTAQEPVFVGGFGELEVPQVFEWAGRWHCLFCTSAKHWSERHARESGQRPVTGGHYLIADHPRGPWKIAPGPFLDAAEPPARYAQRIVFTQDGPRLLGFSMTPGGGAFRGEITDPSPIALDENGLLTIAEARHG